MVRIGKDGERPAAASTSSNSAGRTAISTTSTSSTTGITNSTQTLATSTVRGDPGMNRGGSTHRASELRARAADASQTSGAHAANRKSDQDAIADALKVLSISSAANTIAAANEGCKEGDIKKMRAVQTLIKHRLLDANARLANGNTLFHSIVFEEIDPSYDQTDRAGYLSIAERIDVLAELGADVSVNGENGYTPLHLAVLTDDPHIVETLLKHEKNVGFRKENGQPLKMTHFRADDGKTPLHLAAEMGNNARVIELLIAAGADVDDGDNFDNRPLHLAVGGECDLDVIWALIEGGADVNAVNQNSMAPIHFAASRDTCNPNAMLALVDRGADINARAAASGRTAMHFAAEHADEDTVDTLLALGGDVNAVDFFGRTSLHEAAGRGDADIALALLEAGAKPNIKDRQNATPLRLAVSLGFDDDEVADVLQHFGAKLK